MRRIIFLLLSAFVLGCSSSRVEQLSTFCNPVDLSYRFCSDKPSRREAADPTIITFKGTYYLFASKSGGYWHSDDLHHWTFIETSEIPVEEYAPTAIVIQDTVYFLASSNDKSTIYKTHDPRSGKWSIAREALDVPVWDPAFFQDDDGRLYLYWGCSNVNPLYGVELDYRKNFAFIGKPQALIYPKPQQNGWEVPGDYNTLINQSPWIEGTWMNKHQGVYYLQYSGPGTEFKSYSNGVYVSTNPLGPFKEGVNNPFTYKPEGFVNGAGHGSTFQDKHGNYWNISTATISVKQMFERRIVLYPAFFDKEGVLFSSSRMGDYPIILPAKKITNPADYFTGWMLLSLNKPVEVSSAIDTLAASNMTDENIRTYWAARSEKAGEYAILDLGEMYDIHAVQINFAEHNTEIFGRKKGIRHRYTLEHSTDKKNWSMVSDQSENQSDNTHCYLQLPKSIKSRYLRLTNVEIPDGNFAVSDFRVFGKGNGKLPSSVNDFQITRESGNRRTAHLSWDKAESVIGYSIAFGTAPDKLYNHYTVYGDTTVAINVLNSSQKYYFRVESFNETGIAESKRVISVD